MEQDARARVHAAKISLGGRGTPWWEQSMSQRQARWEPPAGNGARQAR